MRFTKFLYMTTAAATCLPIGVAGYYLARSAQPSADVLAAYDAQFPSINIKDFAPGDVKVIGLYDLPIIVWHRGEKDMALATSQNDPTSWHVKYSKVLGRAEPVFADDANLTLQSEWFFAVAHPPESSQWILLPRSGDFYGFFDVKYAGHYDLAGRARTQGRENLTVVMAEISEDGQTLKLDLRH